MSAPAFSILPLALIEGIWPGDVSEWAAFWLLFGAPPLALARWLWTSGMTYRRSRALVSFVGFWVFVVVWAGVNVKLSEQHEKVQAEAHPVWFGKGGTQQEADRLVINGQLFNTTRAPWEGCIFRFCDGGGYDPPCVEATAIGDTPGWLVPGQAVYRTFSRPVEGASADAKLCCYEPGKKDDDPAKVSCLQGQDD